MTLDRYCSLTWKDRLAVHQAVDNLIEASNPDGEGGGLGDGRPKRARR